MTWTKTGDDWPDRLIDLSDAAYRLLHAAITYSNRVGSDGVISRTRLTLIPVPSKTRRASVIRELVEAGLWLESERGWTIAGFFDSQLSAEEARLTTEYNRVREAKRLAKHTENEAVFALEESAVLKRLQAARERRKARSRTANGSANGDAPLVPVPSRSVIRERGRERESIARPPKKSVGDAETEPLARCIRCKNRIPYHKPNCVERQVAS